jgi:hypothetical protein
MTLKNPYRPGRYVTGLQFYGRQGILHALEHGDYRGAYIIGTRQMGKTSLLREMERQLPAFYVDVSYMGHDLSRWAKHLQRSVGRKRPTYNWLPDAATAAPGFLDLLEQVAHAAEDNKQKVWLLLDEAEDLMSMEEAQPGFLARLRGATEMLPALRLTLAGYRSLLELREAIPPHYLSPLLGAFISFVLPPLSAAEATALICQEKMLPSVQVEEAVVKQILAEADGHPFLLQRLCNALWKVGMLRPLDEIILHRISADAENVFPADFELLSDVEQQVLLGLSQQKEATFAEIETILTDKSYHLSKSLQDLVDLGFLYRTSTGYAISSQVLARWLASLKNSGEMPSPISDPVVIELHSADKQEKQLEELLRIHRDNLHHYEKIKAQCGFDVPLHVISGLEYEKEAIQRLQKDLETLRGTEGQEE